MITVLIQLWPFGDEDRAKEIGRMYIANDGAGTYERGDYKVAVCRRGRNEVPAEIYLPEAPELAAEQPAAARAAEVKDYPRLAYNVWRLIARAVLAAFPEEARRAKRDERTLLDEHVMRGLQLLAKVVPIPNWTPRTEDDHYVKAAIEWLNTAFADEVAR